MSHPAELNDVDWLRRRYQVISDDAIATELGVDRKTVRAARQRHGIPSQPRGPRRGAAPVMRSTVAIASPAPAPDVTSPTTRLVAERVARERGDGGFGPAVLSQRVRAVAVARVSGDPAAVEDAIVGVASAAVLWLDQLLLARAATPTKWQPLVHENASAAGVFGFGSPAVTRAKPRISARIPPALVEREKTRNPHGC